MTDHAMRQRLAEAMGWTNISWTPDGNWGYAPDDGEFNPLPNPLESDRDAALLRAWCVGRGWVAELRCDRYMAVGTVRDYVDVILGQGMATPDEAPDPCRRERLALCRAVLQALEAGGAA